MKKEKIVEKIKVIGEIASSSGAQALACGICRAILPPGVNVVVKGGVLFGGLLLGGCIGEHLNDYMNRQIDSVVDIYDETAERIKEDIATIQKTSEEEHTEGTDQTDQQTENNENGDLG